ncbi:MAG: Resolvase domain [Candidatus Peregrinibacteria bacterium Greene0416_62]|nr:MAG: Resolvase domain [Candidatus Peregrinibacteria bacterium Greene0416_62]
MKQRAVIYCRVSSERQVKEGHGLDAQESRGKAYAEQHGYEVVKVFREEGISGGLLDRPAMQEMLLFLEQQPLDLETIVIIDDLKRWARDVQGHFMLKTAIYSRNARLESPTHRFDDSPEGKFVETVLAGAAELERNQNKRQVVKNMKSRLEAGYWVFDYPPGFKYKKVTGHGKLLVHDEPKATIVTEALEGFASERMQQQTDVQRFLESRNFQHRRKHKGVHLEQVKRLLTQPLYAGYLEYPKWGVKRTKAKHKGLISFATFERIQGRLQEQEKAPHRKDLNKDFPLRGFVCCTECKKPYTASWAKGRNKSFAYYRCNTKGCALYNKSIKRDLPQPQILNLTKAIVMDVWKNESANVHRVLQKREDRLKEIADKIETYYERIDQASNNTVISGYEAKIEELGNEKLRIGENIGKIKKGAVSFETAVTVVFDFVQNPSKMWNKGELSEQRLVLRLVFSEPLYYRLGTGFETASLSLPFALSGMKGVSKSKLVDLMGFEPTWS